MNAIPSGVESALVEAGFSNTEVSILQRLVLESALTLREIAGRSGKSTGVLDQAMKKLIQKNIVHKDMINDTAKYTMTSWDAVLRWMEEDDRRKRDLMARRQQNFEAFLRTVQEDKKRPDIEYFEGVMNFPKAYRKLLASKKELLCYEPVFCSIEDHPLRDFMVEWFRIRHKNGVFSRVITHNTPLGRRYQSRDPFEYRKSALIDEQDYPFTFEKIIAGDMVACFNYGEKCACLLRYPELASMERGMFDALWRQATTEKAKPAAPSLSAPTGQLPPVLIPTAEPVPLSVRTISQFREFLISRNSLAAFAVITVLSAAITFGLYQYTKHLQFARMQETVKSIAATGALQFDAKDLDALRVEEDWKKPEWGRVVRQMIQIRRNNADITFAYILRKKPGDPTTMEFVADSHSLNPYANVDEDPNNNLDLDGDGIIEPEGNDYLQWPGQEYLNAPNEILEGYIGPTTDEKFYEDAWGKFISGYAPIKDDKDRVAGVFAVDMKATILADRTIAVFQPIFSFFGIFFLFVLIRLAAFNKSLFVELWNGLQMRRALNILAICSGIAFVITFGLYQYMLRLTINEIGSRVMSIVATAALEINPVDLDQLHNAEDMKKEEYQRVFSKINQVRDVNPDIDIKFIYTYRPMGNGIDLEFIVDADSNYNLSNIGPDYNEDGKLDESDENVSPGMKVPDSHEEMHVGLEKPTHDRTFYPSQWGTLVSGYAPIKGTKIQAALGADVDVSDVYESLYRKFIPWMWFVGGLTGLLISYLIFVKIS
ncbi:MAG: hypothetical protein HOO67_03580, partial [Candidatus Peribacteraceae bacterium]|nr:hypothetical protein [Candidatus Peribacteraceae bacterium]